MQHLAQIKYIAVCLAAFALTESCGGNLMSESADPIIALERRALDRWGHGDPTGYLELMAPEVTYFDPAQKQRIDGHSAMQELLAPLTGKIQVDRYEMLNPVVQRHGDVAILSYNLISHPAGKSTVVRWNSTEVYARIGGAWKIVHNHWSYITPELKQPVSE